MAQQVSGLNFITFYVSDVFKELDFFDRLLGFEVIANDMIENYAVIQPRLRQGMLIRIVKHDPDHPFHNKGNNVELNIEVDNLDDIISVLHSEDVKIEKLPQRMPWGWRHAWVRDPVNNLISLYQTDGQPMTVGPSRAGTMAFHTPKKSLPSPPTPSYKGRGCRSR